jgi:hypothetical protein
MFDFGEKNDFCTTHGLYLLLNNPKYGSIVRVKYD